MDISLIVSIIAGIITGAKWVYEYSEKIKWEKNKFLLEQIEKFQSLESTQSVQKCLDWNSITISYNGDDFKINDEILYEALQTHDKKHKFRTDEVIVRKIFDEYFDNMTKLVFMSKANLIKKENLIMFLEYWFKIIKGSRTSKTQEFVKRINDYLIFYGYDTLHDFIYFEVE